MNRREFLATGMAPAAFQERRAARPLPESSGGLRFRTLGRTGLKVTSVGFGCMITSDGSVIERAADLGINYFDTARGYQQGNNERMVGAALKARRKQVVLSSKTHADGLDEAMKELEKSLSELGTDYLDIWYLHAKTRPDQILPALIEAQQKARKQGKIRFAGVSTHGGHAEVLPALAANEHIDVVLTSYNFTMDPKMSGLLDSLHQAGKGIVAMKVMAGGFRRARPGDPVYTRLKRDGAMLAALKWALKNPQVHTTVPSMTDMEQLDENMKAMTAPFTGEEEQILARHLEYIAPLYCRMCGECDGMCPQGLPVSDMLRYLSYADGYGQFSLAREKFLALPAETAQVRCGLCPSCSVSCPYGVQVSRRLSRAQELLA